MEISKWQIRAFFFFWESVCQGNTAFVITHISSLYCGDESSIRCIPYDNFILQIFIDIYYYVPDTSKMLKSYTVEYKQA